MSVEVQKIGRFTLKFHNKEHRIEVYDGYIKVADVKVVTSDYYRRIKGFIGDIVKFSMFLNTLPKLSSGAKLGNPLATTR